MESSMPTRDRINEIFDALDLVVVRLTLLALLVIGAYTVIRGHPQPTGPPTQATHSASTAFSERSNDR
jgi:hypothetical protein